jgi:hypothetical protein
MVFTQGPLSLGESFGHEPHNSSLTFCADGDSGTPSLSVQSANLWYDNRDTYIVRFVVVGCRKNLPLCGPSSNGFWDVGAIGCRWSAEGAREISSLPQRFGLLVGNVVRVGDVWLRGLSLDRWLVFRFGRAGWRFDHLVLPAIPADDGFD